MRLQLLPQTLTPGATATGSAITAGNITGSTLTPGQTFSAVTTSALTMPNGTLLPVGSQTQVIFLGQGTVTPQQAAQVLNPAAGGAATAAMTTAPNQTVLLQAGGQSSSALLLTGTVLPSNSAEARMLPNGFTALRTSAGIVGIKLPMPAPTGATLSFSVDASGSGRVATSMPMTEADLMMRGQTAALSRDWGSLQQALSALQQHDPGAALSLIHI